MKSIQELVSLNRIHEAISLISGEDGILLEARWRELTRQMNLNLLSYSEANIARNKIIQAVLSHADGSRQRHEPINLEERLITIIKENKRREERGWIVERAKTLLVDLQAYNNKKQIEPGFDISKRFYKSLNVRFIQIETSLQIKQEKLLESDNQRISRLIGQAIPDWTSISNAYDILAARGFTSQRIKTIIDSRVEDDTAKITVLDFIENAQAKLT